MKVTTVCYGSERVWNSKKEAIKDFREAAMMCDGCERERYQNIVWKLEEGFKVADDTDNWDETQQRLTIRKKKAA